MARLTESELNLLRRLADGATHQNIARELKVSNSAVAMRIFRMREKIGALSSPHAVAMAFRSGLLPVGTTDKQARP